MRPVEFSGSSREAGSGSRPGLMARWKWLTSFQEFSRMHTSDAEFAVIFSISTCTVQTMKLRVIVHEAEEGGYWAEVPAIPGCATQGDSFEELLANLYEAIEGCLAVDVE